MSHFRGAMTSKINAVLVSQIFANSGGEFVVISPGSRNAPLIKSFQNIDSISCLSIVDERCASFFALGISLATKKPVAVVCTSGTALLNYSPAVAEAYYLGLPLTVISADRPENRIDTGEGQSIRQQNVYENFQKGFLNLPEEGASSNYNIQSVWELLKSARINKAGPVHFNLPFSEPLYNEVNQVDIIDKLKVDISDNAKESSDYDCSALKEIWNSTKSKLIVCGKLECSDKLRLILVELNKREDVIVIFESISNLSSVCGISTIDRTLAASNKKVLEPELVITVGEHIISKKIKQFLRQIDTLTHWHFGLDGKELNTFECDNSTTFTLDPIYVLQKMHAEGTSLISTYNSIWKHYETIGKTLHSKYLSNIPFSDLQIFDLILPEIPKKYHLHSGNSSVIRYIQLFDFEQWQYCHANRGTSGIDGSTSTALGYAFAKKVPTVLITGDISFLYDSNALWNNYVPCDFRIIVINNGGGGIFRFISGPDTVENYEEFFETPHNIDIKQLASAYGFLHSSANNKIDLISELDSFYTDSVKPKILEIQTPRKVNANVLKDYFSFIERNK